MQHNDEHAAARAEHAGRFTWLDVGAVVCAGLAGLYMLIRGVWWWLLWVIGG